jgi:hypothetical protein
MSLYSRAETNAQSLKVLNTTEKNSVDKYDWDNTLIVDGDSTVVGSQGYTTAARRSIFIDDVEATLPENRERGLTAPGWWEYFTYTDASGATRHKAQHLVAFKDAPVNTADFDDNVAADVASSITISVQPANQSTDDVDGTATFSVTASADAGSVGYQWQLQTATGTRWTNITGATSASLALTGLVVADTGKKYRVKLTSSAGAEEIISNTATLTVTAA